MADKTLLRCEQQLCDDSLEARCLVLRPCCVGYLSTHETRIDCSTIFLFVPTVHPNGPTPPHHAAVGLFLCYPPPPHFQVSTAPSMLKPLAKFRRSRPRLFSLSSLRLLATEKNAGEVLAGARQSKKRETNPMEGLCGALICSCSGSFVFYSTGNNYRRGIYSY